jgi:hypothetical protein
LPSHAAPHGSRLTGAPIDQPALLEANHVVVDAAGRREPDLAGHLPQARRETMLVVEALQRREHLALPLGQVFHAVPPGVGWSAACAPSGADPFWIDPQLWMSRAFMPPTPGLTTRVPRYTVPVREEG